MAKSRMLRTCDVRALIRLVGECRDLGDDRAAWRWHFLERLAGVIGAEAGLNGEMAGCLSLKNVDMGVVFWWPGGFTPPPFWDEHMARFRHDPGYSPAMAVYHALTRDERGRALSREDFIADRDWYGSHDFLKIQEPLGLDASLWCFRPIPSVRADESTGIVLLREKGRRGFSRREQAIAREAHAAISPLVGGALARFADPTPADLAPRRREVLSCLLEGDGDKQVAARLGMSVYTVNEHTKAIFRHFGVRGRAELLARWLRRGWGHRLAGAARFDIRRP